MYWRIKFDFGNWSSLLCDGVAYPALQFIDPNFHYEGKEPEIMDPQKLAYSFDRRDTCAIPNFPSSGMATFVCKPEVTNQFHGLFEKYCRSFVVPVEGEPYDAHIVENELEGIDWDRSEY